MHWLTRAFGALLIACSPCLFACEDTGKASAEQAKAHVGWLRKTIAADVKEIQNGLPAGAEHLKEFFESEIPAKQNAAGAREALETARSKVQDLRVAKSTFFAVVDKDGTIIRNDQEQDLMAGKNLFGSFDALRGALSGKYVEARGSMKEAAGVRGRPDGQWVAAVPVRVKNQVAGLYVTGWSWARYAYRLELSLRNDLKSSLSPGDNLPLVYVYLVVGDAAYGAPISPDVNAKVVVEQRVLSKAQDKQIYATPLEITGRQFGLAAGRVPELGQDVAVAVLHSET